MSEAHEVDVEFALSVALMTEVDRAVSGYKRKLAGRAEFCNFAALVPASVRTAA